MVNMLTRRSGDKGLLVWFRNGSMVVGLGTLKLVKYLHIISTLSGDM